MEPDVRVRDFVTADREWAERLVKACPGGTAVGSGPNELVDALSLEGLVAESGGRPIGLATVRETPDGGMELVTLHTEPPGRGAGTALLETAWQVAAASGHRRLWLLTANDNLDAIHFYLRRGMRVAAVHEGAVELQLLTDPSADTLGGVAFPRIEDLDRLPVAAFVHEVMPLFEGGPRFLARFAGERPFATNQGLIDAAFEVAHGLPEEERLELVEGHARIGAPPESVSEASHAEQGYADESPQDAEVARAYEELAMLNEIYEQRFGFRYVIFVAGRPKTAIVPLLEHALRNDREAELRRAIDDTIYIAGDRLATLRT